MVRIIKIGNTVHSQQVNEVLVKISKACQSFRVILWKAGLGCTLWEDWYAESRVSFIYCSTLPAYLISKHPPLTSRVEGKHTYIPSHFSSSANATNTNFPTQNNPLANITKHQRNETSTKRNMNPLFATSS